MKKHINLTLFKLVLGGIGILLILGLLFLFILPKMNRPFTVLMYGLTETEETHYTTLIPRKSRIEKIVEGTELTDKILKRADSVIALRNSAIMLKEHIFQPLPTQNILVVPPSLQKAIVHTDGKNYGLPLQIDHYELAWEYEKFEKLNLAHPESLAAFEKALSKHKKGPEPALLFAGNNTESLVALISSLCLANFGYDGYVEACENLKVSQKLEDLIGSPIYKSISILSNWNQKGYLHPEWFNMNDGDVREYLNRGFGFMVFGSLTFHRSVEYQAIYKYNSTRFPWIGQPDTLVAPMTVFYAKPRKKQQLLSDNLRAKLSSPKIAHTLAKATGKSTAISAAQAPDVQAADVLYWAASSVRTVNGLYHDAFVDPKQADIFAETVREMIRTNK